MTNEERPTASPLQEIFRNNKIVLTLRSYCRNILCYRSCSYHKLGGFWQIRSRSAEFCKGKSFTEDPSNGNQEESKKEETLTVCETSLRMGQDFNQPLRRSTS